MELTYLEQAELKKFTELVKKNTKQALKIKNPIIADFITDIENKEESLIYPVLLYSFLDKSKSYDVKEILNLSSSLQILYLSNVTHNVNCDENNLIEKVYSGDFLFTTYFYLLSNTTNSLNLIQINSNFTKKILIGELDRTKMKYNNSLTIKEYFRYISDKNASLYSLSCYQGAIYGDYDDEIKRLSIRIGHSLGMYITLNNEYLKNKQPSKYNIKKGIYSLPLIIALNKSEQDLNSILVKKNQMTDLDLSIVTSAMKDCKCEEILLTWIDYYRKKSYQLINKLPKDFNKNIFNNLIHESKKN